MVTETGESSASAPIGRHLALTDLIKVRRIFEKFRQLEFTDFAVTGSVALNALLDDDQGASRRLNDLDLVVPCFNELPKRLGDHFLVNHAHRHRPQGKLALQLACPETAIRIDIFTTCEGVFERVRPAAILRLPACVVSLEDLTARIVSELMVLVRGGTVDRKVARAYQRVAPLIGLPGYASAWGDQRKAGDPNDFVAACEEVGRVLLVADNRLVEPTYAADWLECPHCVDTRPFTLADPERIRALIGYY